MDPFGQAEQDAWEIMAERHPRRVDSKSEEIETRSGVSGRQECRGVSSPLHGVEEVDPRSLSRPLRTVIENGEPASGSRKAVATDGDSSSMRRAGRNFNVQREEGPLKRPLPFLRSGRK